LRSESGEGMQ
jgi:hypothetical protein